MTRRAARRAGIAVAALLLILSAGTLRAQLGLPTVSAGNPYVRVSVSSDTAWGLGAGLFTINAGPYHNNYYFLSNLPAGIVFRVTSAGGTQYFTNINRSLGRQPMIDSVTPVPYRGFDSLYSSFDTIAVGWKGLNGMNVTMRMIPERPMTEYDRGSDVLIEFSYARVPGAPPAELGILMVLDVLNTQTNFESPASILTSSGSFPNGRFGKLFAPPAAPIPDFYHMVDAQYHPPLNTVMPIHRLRGRSHNGAPLTTPDLFAIGDWQRLRGLAWEIAASDVDTSNIGDAGTATRWGGLRESGTVRTAFGMNNAGANDMFHCRDTALFVDIQTVRTVPANTGSVFTERKFDVTMWVTNTGQGSRSLTVELFEPIGIPAAAGRLALDGTPAAQTQTLATRETKKIVWRLKTLPGFNDSLITIPLDFRYHYNNAPNEAFRMPCTPVITMSRTPPVAPPVDAVPPVIERVSVPHDAVYSWTFRAHDRGDGRFNTGLDSVVADVQYGANVNLTWSAIRKCDTNATTTLTARWRDTLKPVRLLFAVRDCWGNETRDSIVAEARVRPSDNRPPRFILYDSAYEAQHFRVSDRHAGFEFDTGIDSIVAERIENFVIEGNPFQRCDTSVVPSFSAVVNFTKFKAFLALAIYDCAGNVTRDTIVHMPASGVAEEPGSPGGLAIVTLRPQPFMASEGKALEMTIVGLRGGHARADLIAADGRIVASLDIGEPAGRGVTYALRVPGDLPSGVYIVRVADGVGAVVEKVIVIE